MHQLKVINYTSVRISNTYRFSLALNKAFVYTYPPIHNIVHYIQCKFSYIHVLLGHHKKYDITYCCNLLLHLPSIEKPISNLLKTTKKICIFRTLASKNTHLSKFLYDDKLNSKGEPVNFVYQNTFSFNFIKRVLRKNGAKKIRILQDEFKGNNVNKEFKKYQNKQSAVTQVIKNDIQIAGSKVFEWKWFKVYL